MTIFKKLFFGLALFSALVVGFGISGCVRRESPAENAGDEIEDVVEEAGDELEEAGDEVEDATD